MMSAITRPPGPIIEHYKGLPNALQLHLRKTSTAMSGRNRVFVRDAHHISSQPDVQQLEPSPPLPIVEEPEVDKYTRNREILQAATSYDDTWPCPHSPAANTAQFFRADF